MKEQENGSVIQRFCLALLQKCSVKDTVIPTMLENDMIGWLMSLIKRSVKEKIHHFSLDFGSALLANIIHAPTTLAGLAEDPKQAQMVGMSPYSSWKQCYDCSGKPTFKSPSSCTCLSASPTSPRRSTSKCRKRIAISCSESATLSNTTHKSTPPRTRPLKSTRGLCSTYARTCSTPKTSTWITPSRWSTMSSKRRIGSGNMRMSKAS